MGAEHVEVRDESPAAWSYGIAAAGVVLAGLSPWWLSPLIDDTPPMRLMLVLVVTAAAWLGGLGPGLLATALGLVAIVAADDRPADRHALVVRLARFGSLALLIDALFAAVHAQRRRAERREQELVRAERALREKESLLRSFYDSSAMAMGVIELTDGDARIVSANAPTDRLFGREAGRGRGQDGAGAGPIARSAGGLARSARRCRATGRPVRFEQQGAWPAGPEWIAATLSAMQIPGHRRRPLLVPHRGHHRAQADRGRPPRRQGAGRGRLAAKDRFLAVLSHELRTPLTPVLIAVSSLLESGTDPALCPRWR